MMVIYKFMRNQKLKISQDIYWWHQERMQKKYRALYAKWNDVSRKLFELQLCMPVHCRQGLLCYGNKDCDDDSVCKKYRKLYAKATSLRHTITELENIMNR